MEIREVDYGIANNFGDYIEINKNLKAFDERLYLKVLRHEMRHTNAKGYTNKDFMLDISDDSVGTIDILRFMVRHPKAMTQLLPFYKKGKLIIYDINMIIVWSVMLIALGLTLYFNL